MRLAKMISFLLTYRFCSTSAVTVGKFLAISRRSVPVLMSHSSKGLSLNTTTRYCLRMDIHIKQKSHSGLLQAPQDDFNFFSIWQASKMAKCHPPLPCKERYNYLQSFSSSCMRLSEMFLQWDLCTDLSLLQSLVLYMFVASSKLFNSLQQRSWAKLESGVRKVIFLIIH